MIATIPLLIKGISCILGLIVLIALWVIYGLMRGSAEERERNQREREQAEARQASPSTNPPSAGGARPPTASTPATTQSEKKHWVSRTVSIAIILIGLLLVGLWFYHSLVEYAKAADEKKAEQRAHPQWAMTIGEPPIDPKMNNNPIAPLTVKSFEAGPEGYRIKVIVHQPGHYDELNVMTWDPDTAKMGRFVWTHTDERQRNRDLTGDWYLSVTNNGGIVLLGQMRLDDQPWCTLMLQRIN